MMPPINRITRIHHDLGARWAVVTGWNGVYRKRVSIRMAIAASIPAAAVRRTDDEPKQRM
jgi:hypothetical protein